MAVRQLRSSRIKSCSARRQAYECVVGRQVSLLSSFLSAGEDPPSPVSVAQVLFLDQPWRVVKTSGGG